MKRSGLALVLAFGLSCGAEDADAPLPEPPAPTLKAGPGVDVASRVIAVGALNDESGAAATIGRPFAQGKRLLAARIDAGASGLLPPGWTIRLVERDHRYDPHTAVRAYEEIKDDVLFFGTSFGTPNTVPLLPLLERDGIVAFPASLSSDLAQHVHTPPLAPSYRIEAMRAADWAPRSARWAIVYQEDDYGADAKDGLEASASLRGAAVVGSHAIAPGTKDFAAIVASLRRAGATHVLLATLPSTTGPLLRTAWEEGFTPTWVGATPAWSDKFFAPQVVSSAVFATYHQLSVTPYWGEDVPGMAEFIGAWDTWRQPLDERDSIVLLSYVQGLVQVEAARRAIEAGDITREGYLQALRSIDGWDAGGLIQPVSFTTFPYVVGTKARVLRPDFAKGSWKVVSAYAEPRALTPPEAATP